MKIRLFVILPVFSLSACSDAGLNILAEHIKTCSPLEQVFSHPFTGDSLTRSIKGFKGDACHYIEQLPGNGKMECFYPREKLSQLEDFYLNFDEYKTFKVRSRTEFIDGNPVTRTEYFKDGKKVFHPMGDSFDKGECEVLGYN